MQNSWFLFLFDKYVYEKLQINKKYILLSTASTSPVTNSVAPPRTIPKPQGNFSCYKLKIGRAG